MIRIETTVYGAHVTVAVVSTSLDNRTARIEYRAGRLSYVTGVGYLISQFLDLMVSLYELKFEEVQDDA